MVAQLHCARTCGSCSTCATESKNSPEDFARRTPRRRSENPLSVFETYRMCLGRAEIRQQMARCRTPAQQAPLRQRAMQILKRKQMYMNRRSQLDNRTFTMEQLQFGIQAAQDAKMHVEAVKYQVRRVADPPRRKLHNRALPAVGPGPSAVS